MSKEKFTKIFNSIRPDKKGCIIWERGTERYGRMKSQGETQKAHRLSYKYFVGPIPQGLFVLHKCDVPRCINPDHLFVGTQRANVKDCIEKQRQCKGTGKSKAKLTEIEVLCIRAWKNELTRDRLAQIFGISKKQLYEIIRGKYWKHMK